MPVYVMLTTMVGVVVAAYDGAEDNEVVDDVHIQEVVALPLHSRIYHRGPLVKDNILVAADTHTHRNDDVVVARNRDDSNVEVAYNIPDDIPVVVVHNVVVVDSDRMLVDYPHYYWHPHYADIPPALLDHHVVVVVEGDNNTNDDVHRVALDIPVVDRKSTRLNSSHVD